MGSKKSLPTFKQFWRGVEAKARARSPEAIERLHDLRAAFRLARELVNARQKRGLTQQTVAQLTGITQADISRYERGQGNPGFLTLDKLGKVYGGLTILFGRATSQGTHSKRRTEAAKKRTGSDPSIESSTQ